MTRQPSRPVGARRLAPQLRRERQINRLLLISGGLLILLIIAIPGFAYYQDIIARGQSVAVRVNGVTFSLNEFVDRLAYRDRLLTLQFAAVNDPQLQQFLQQQRASIPEQVKNELVDGVLLRQEAERRGITVSPEEIDSTIQEEFGAASRVPTPQPAVSPSPSPSPTPEPTPTIDAAQASTRYQNFLKQAGVSEDLFRQSVQMDLLRDKITEELKKEIPQTAEQVRFRAIVLRTQEEAQQVLNELQSGADFAAVAAEKSIDEKTKTQGGQYDWVARGTREANFENRVFEAPPGLLPEPVPGLGGFAVVDVQEKDPARPLTPEQRETFERQAYSKWLEAQKKQASIETNLTPENQEWALRRAERQNKAAGGGQ